MTVQGTLRVRYQIRSFAGKPDEGVIKGRQVPGVAEYAQVVAEPH
jgi:hypothetical protein